jgi:Protein of unknown function (DUF3102)
MKRNAGQRIAEGQRLLKAKASVPHGQWLAWLKANCDVSVAAAQRYMCEAKAVEVTQQQAMDLGSAWAAATMEERCTWLSQQGQQFEHLWHRVKSQDEVMQRRGQPKSSYKYTRGRPNEQGTRHSGRGTAGSHDPDQGWIKLPARFSDLRRQAMDYVREHPEIVEEARRLPQNSRFAHRARGVDQTREFLFKSPVPNRRSAWQSKSAPR